MITSPRIAALLALLILSACGGMTRTVGVFPQTMDDLGQRSEALRGEPEAAAAAAPTG